jgi:hypothetical protein
MIHIHSEFNGKFPDFVACRDKSLCTDAVLSEIGFLIAHDRANVIYAIRASGIKLESPLTHKKIVDAIIDNIGINKKLQTALAVLIVHANSDDQENFSNTNSSFWGSKKKKDKTVGGSTTVPTLDQVMGTGDKSNDNTSETIGQVSSAIGSIFAFATAIKQADTEKQANKQQLMSSILAAQQGGGKTNNTALYVVLGILGLGLLGTIGYFIYKSSKTTATTTTPIEKPVVTPPANEPIEI